MTHRFHQPVFVARALCVLALCSWVVCKPLPAEPPKYENTALSVAYVGSEKCIECHESQHESFLATLHSKAAQPTSIGSEPPAGKYAHRESGNGYEVAAKNGKMYHTEVLRLDSGDPSHKTSYEMQVTLGSGTNAKSYLHREGNFHIQSPLTFYADEKSWSMSPGYEVPSHRSFRRAVTTRCVFCHVGTIEQKKDNPYKFEITEAKIGCERCHGPGQLHIERHRNADLASSADSKSEIDTTIVNPKSLSRELSEAVCQQCHCQGVQNINVTTRDEWEYRPGLRLTDYRADFQLETGNNEMRLVGHVEQMHRSRCYTESGTLTCITCHNPHDPPTKDTLVEHHREACYSCHEDQACGKSIDHRMTENGNDCAKCHMPRADTNVSHFALHNHQIGIHEKKGKVVKPETTAKLAPILDLSHLPAWEQKRLEGLAKFELHRRFGGLPKFADYDIQAAESLLSVRQQGVSDLDMDAALIWMAWEQGQPAIAESLAKELLAKEKGESMARIIATNILARIHFARQDFPTALKLYRELATLHRDARDFYFLGLAEQNNRNFEEAIAALKRSIEIEPSQIAAHNVLKIIYESTGRPDEAKVHEKMLEANQEIQSRQAKVVYEKPQP